MSRVRYDFKDDITITEFIEALESAAIKYEISDGPTHFYPYIRVWSGDTKFVARTNWHKHVVRLIPVDDLTEDHRKLANFLAGLFDTEIIVEDFTLWGSGLPWAKALWEKQQHADTAQRWGFV